MCLGGTRDAGTGDVGTARGRRREWSGKRGAPVLAAPPVQPGPTLDVRWRRETETRGSGPGGGRGVGGVRGRAGRGVGGRAVPPRAPCCRLERGGVPCLAGGWRGGHVCCWRHILRQLCPARRAASGQRAGSARTVPGNTRAPRGHGTATAPARHQCTWPQHQYGTAMAPVRWHGRGTTTAPALPAAARPQPPHGHGTPRAPCGSAAARRHL